MKKILHLPGLSIDYTAVHSVLSADGLPRWFGRVNIVFTDSVDKTTTMVIGLLHGAEQSERVYLVDFEGEPEDGDPIYEACELFAPQWASELSKVLGKPSYAEAEAA